MPGAFGTLDEAFDTLTLLQCHKLDRFPIVAMGAQFWGQMRNFVRNALVSEETIGPEDLDLLRVTDSPEEALAYIGNGLSGPQVPLLERESTSNTTWLAEHDVSHTGEFTGQMKSFGRCSAPTFDCTPRLNLALIVMAEKISIFS